MVHGMYLVLQNKDEDVVSSYCQHQEGHNLQNDQRRGDADPGVEAHGSQDRAADHQDPTQTHQELGVHLEDRATLIQMCIQLSEPCASHIFAISCFLYCIIVANKPFAPLRS